MTDIAKYRPWKYVPSVAAAVVVLLIFLALTAWTFWRIWQTRAKFCIAFALGGFFEIMGYAARASARNKLDRLMPYVVQNFFILMAPALFAASIYMTLGRLMQSVHGEHHSLIRTRWLTKFFVGGDVLSFVIQGAAAPLMVIAHQKYLKLGEGVVIAGLFIQLCMFGLFIVTCFVFERRMKRQLTPTHSEATWCKTTRMLYLVSALVMVRSVFRVIEYIMGYDGYLLRHEWTLYIFDTMLMAGVMGLFLWRFPGDILSRAPAKAEDHLQI